MDLLGESCSLVEEVVGVVVVAIDLGVEVDMVAVRGNIVVAAAVGIADEEEEDGHRIRAVVYFVQRVGCCASYLAPQPSPLVG